MDPEVEPAEPDCRDEEYPDSFRRELMTEYDSATRFWIGAEAKLRKNLSALARVEDTVSDRYNKDIRARLALNYDF